MGMDTFLNHFLLSFLVHTLQYSSSDTFPMNSLLSQNDQHKSFRSRTPQAVVKSMCVTLDLILNPSSIIY